MPYDASCVLSLHRTRSGGGLSSKLSAGASRFRQGAELSNRQIRGAQRSRRQIVAHTDERDFQLQTRRLLGKAGAGSGHAAIGSAGYNFRRRTIRRKPAKSGRRLTFRREFRPRSLPLPLRARRHRRYVLITLDPRLPVHRFTEHDCCGIDRSATASRPIVLGRRPHEKS
jgi:hypothetical protein